MGRNHATTIESLKAQLIEVAEKHGMNLRHPEVVAASQELDLLILESMVKPRKRQAC